MKKPSLPKETVESFTLLTILVIICLGVGTFVGYKFNEVEHDYNKYQYAKKLDQCLQTKIHGQKKNEDFTI
jgi:hypothetical protein